MPIAVDRPIYADAYFSSVRLEVDLGCKEEWQIIARTRK